MNKHYTYTILLLVFSSFFSNTFIGEKYLKHEDGLEELNCTDSDQRVHFNSKTKLVEQEEGLYEHLGSVKNIKTNSSNALVLASGPCLPGEMGGKVFIDLNGNGLLETTELGPLGVEVQIFECNSGGTSTLIETVTTDQYGDYHFTNASIVDGKSYRIEFSNIPSGFISSIAGDDNGTATQYVDAISCAVNYGILDPLDYCGADPQIGVVCFTRNTDPDTEANLIFIRNSAGRVFSPDNANDNNRNWAIPAGSNAGNYPLTHQAITAKSDLHTTFGLTWSRTHATMYSGAYMRAFATMGANTSANGFAEAAIYKIPFANEVPQSSSVWLDLEDASIFGDGVAGEFIADAPYPGPAVYGRTSNNPNKIGYTGLGSMKISKDNSEMYVVNLNAREVLVIPIGANGEAPTSSAEIKRFPLPDTNCTGSWPDGRAHYAALGLGVHPSTGRVFATVTCTGPTTADVTGFVYSFDPSDTTPSSSDFDFELEIPLDFIRPATNPNINSWYAQINHPWETVTASNVFYSNGSSSSNQHTQPWLGEIEFDLNSDGEYGMILAERNRYHDLINSSFYVTGGTILRACNSGSVAMPDWNLESSGSCGSTYTSSVNWTTSGQNGRAGTYTQEGNRFFKYVGAEGSMSAGTMTMINGTGEVIMPVMDNVFYSGTSGITWLNTETGDRSRDNRILSNFTSGGFNATNFTKSNNWGAIVAMCAEVPMQIGNYAWIDANGDGVQDPCESSLAGLTVKLYSKPTAGNAQLMATTTTSVDGEYYFTNNTTPGESWESGFEEVQKDSSYYIVVCGDSYDANSKLLNAGGIDFVVTGADTGMGSNADTNDSDVVEISIPGVGDFPAICVTVDEINHSFDIGLRQKPEIEILDADISCGPLSEGGSLNVSITGGVGPFLYDWSEDTYDGMAHVANVPPGNYSVTITDGDGCEATAAAEITVEACVPDPCVAGLLGGYVWEDNNGNGVYDKTELGLQGVGVQLYAADSNGDSQFVEFVYTDPKGDYHFSDPSISFSQGQTYRIEFDNFPDGFVTSGKGIHNYTSVQFVDQMSCDNSLGLLNLAAACGPVDKLLDTELGQGLFNGETLLGPGTALVTCGTITALADPADRFTFGLFDLRDVNVGVDRPEINPTGFHHPDWTVDKIGNVFGVDHDAEGFIYVTASSHYGSLYGYSFGGGANYFPAIVNYGSIGGGADDLGAAGTIYRMDKATGAPSVFAQLPQQETTVTHNGCEDALVVNRLTGPGLGNVSYDNLRDQLFVSNFEDGSIYRLAMDGTVLSTFDPQTLAGFTADDGTPGWSTDAKPYGLTVSQDGNKLFFGTHNLDITPKVYSVDLDANGDFTGTEIYHTTLIADGNLGVYSVGPRWIAISDLETSPTGEIIASLRTGCRGIYGTSHNHGGTNYILDDTDGNGLYDNTVVNINSQYPNDGTGNDDCYGGVAIWDTHDGVYDIVISSSDIKEELGPHGIMVFPCDFTNNNGSGYPLQPSAAIPYISGFNLADFKGVGGDVEVFSPCGPVQINIGNYVWIDINENGIQDPEEDPIANFKVKLYTKPAGGATPALVATTRTNDSGEYYFTDSTSTNEIWESDFAKIEKDASYYVVFCGDGYNATEDVISNDNILFKKTVSDTGMGNNPDINDSDLTVLSIAGLGDALAICYTADTSDYTLDAGFVPKPDVALVQVLDPNYDFSNLSFGDSVKFKMTVFNQSLLKVDSVDLINYLPAGFTFDGNTIGNESWTADANGNPTTRLTSSILAQEKDSLCIYLHLQQADNPLEWINVVEISDAYVNGAAIVDCDSPLNTDPDDNGGSEINTDADDETGGDGTATGPDGVAETDQDNVDPATVPICDLALINKIDVLPSSLSIGDTIKYLVIVENQGTVNATNIDIAYHIPNGLTYLDMNDASTPTWDGSGDPATATIIDELGVGQLDSICIYLAVNNVATDMVTEDSWTTIAEISGYEDPDEPGVAKADVDSTPDSNPNNDSGGNPEDNTDNETGGDGSGDPNDPTEDNDPALDEDDHDPAKIYICDVATKIYIDETGPYEYLDTIKFSAVIFNQGNDTITNVKLADYLGSGLEFVTTSINSAEAWIGDNDMIMTTSTALIAPGESDTICVELLIVDVIPFDEDAYLQIVEVVSFEDPDQPGQPKTDVDSTPDNDPNNDPGGNPNDPTDDVVDGDGSGDPTISSEDTDPALDEDDHDPVLLPIFDLAIQKLLLDDKPYKPNEQVVFDFNIINQGNVGADNFKLRDYMAPGFTFASTGNPGWGLIGSDLEYTSIGSVAPGDTAMVQLQLTIIVPAMPAGIQDWWNYVEISEADNNNNTQDPDPVDADSTPDTVDDNDNGGALEPEDPEDDVVNQNGKEGEDEDDHDTEKVLVGFDLALKKEVVEQGPYKYGDTLTYTLTVYNQGGLTATNIAVYDTIPCGLLYDASINDNDWAYSNNLATTTLSGPSNPGDVLTKDIKLIVQRCTTPAYDNYYNAAEISDFKDEMGDEPDNPDIDSTPDDNPENDGSPNDDQVTDPMDEDDHDFEDIVICDLALHNKLISIPSPPTKGDTVKFEVVVFNQGNHDVNSVDVDYTVPIGFMQLPLNATLSPMWNEENDALASATTNKTIAPNESDSLCVYLVIKTVTVDEVTEDSWTTDAEITSFTNGANEIKTNDADSTPDDDPTNDLGGNPDDDTDDVVDGSGIGDPNDTADDSDPSLDEDDHDPVKVDICDAVLVMSETLPDVISYFDTLVYYVQVFNQGNDPISNITVANNLPEGLKFIPTPMNTSMGWAESGSIPDAVEMMITSELMPGDKDTMAIELMIMPVNNGDDKDWMQISEIMSVEDIVVQGLFRVDSDTSSNVDSMDTKVLDLALLMKIDSMPPVLPVIPGDVLKFITVVVNQGNTPVNNIELTNYLMPDNLKLADMPQNWIVLNDSMNQYTIAEELQAGAVDTICIYLEVVSGAMSDIITWSEISGSTETDGPICYDIDSDPDDDNTNDPGGESETPTDNHITDDGEDGDDNGITDEDDHDPAMLDAQDLALIVWSTQKNPVRVGEDVKFTVRVVNQGNIVNQNIELVTYIPKGFDLSPNDTNGWIEQEEDEVHATLAGSLLMGDTVETCIVLQVQPGYAALDFIVYSEIVSSVNLDGEELTSRDIDSTPDHDNDNDTGGQYEDPIDCNIDPVIIGDDNYTEGASTLGEDEDDHDPAWVPVNDLATIIYTQHTTPLIPGDSIKFWVDIYNQGNLAAENIVLHIYEPAGFSLSANDTNGWVDLGNGLLQNTLVGIIEPFKSDKMCLVLEVNPDFTLMDLIPVVEIFSSMDTLGNDVTLFDLDSDPDNEGANDMGGEIFTSDDNKTNENGKDGGDEDDHDPVVPPIMDLAVQIINTEGLAPKVEGDTVKFKIYFWNQGSMTPSQFTIQEYIPEGLKFLDIPDNSLWQTAGGDPYFVYNQPLLPLTMDSVCISLEVTAAAHPLNVTNMVEISEVFDELNNDVSLLDIDSEADASNDNDKGNEIYSLEDNKLLENGRSGNDEDDHDQAFVMMCQEMVCGGHFNISLDESCSVELTSDLLMEGNVFPTSFYEFTIIDQYGVEHPSSTFTQADIGMTFTVTILAPLCNNSCWTTITVEDKFPPSLDCGPDVIIACNALSTVAAPVPMDNCGGAMLVLLNEVTTNLPCDPLYLMRIERTYQVEDAQGLTSPPCTQTILLERAVLSGVTFPTSLTIAGSNALTCPSSTDPSATGVPTYAGLPIFPIVPSALCNVTVTYVDTDLGSTNCVDKIMRVWTVGEWWCGTIEPPVIWVQMIETVDFEGPSITCPADFTVSTSGVGLNSCLALVEIPGVIVSDICNEPIEVDIETGGPLINNSNGGLAELAVGVHTIRYIAYDACDNSSECSIQVTVLDNFQPTVLCLQNTVVSLKADGTAEALAEVFDNGSYDDCGLSHFEARRMTDNCGVAGNTDFGPTVDFCCADVGTEVMVVLRVYDASGNYNDCMILVEVQDKEAAVLSCPADETLACTTIYDLNNLEAQFGAATVLDNCSGQLITETVEENINACGIGTLRRNFSMPDGIGGTMTCSQLITFENTDLFDGTTDIVWPSDYTTTSVCGLNNLAPSALVAPYDYPVLISGTCDQAGMDFKDQTFEYIPGSDACFKIIRTWTVIDWCQRRADGSFESWSHDQILKVNNTVAPTFVSGCSADILVETFDPNCMAGAVSLLIEGADDCTPEADLSYNYTIDLDSDGSIDQTGATNDASGSYAIGVHHIYWELLDKCGNANSCDYSFEVRNAKSPTPICIQGLSAELTLMDTDGDNIGDTEMVVLWANDFDAGSYHPCGYPVSFSFSPDITDTSVEFVCGQTGQQGIQMWVTDSNGNQDFCTTYVLVTDNSGDCPTTLTVDVQGRVYTEENEDVQEVEVSLMGSGNMDQTASDGLYDFNDMPNGGTYTLSPERLDGVMNGVSTLDLVLIQKHILGLRELDSPYKIIAADINHDDRITAIDLIGLRKLILGIHADFPDNDSWRFVDALYQFPVATNPWAQIFDEDYEIANLTSNMWVDFIGVKIGDVNGSVTSNMTGLATETRGSEALNFEFIDQALAKGEEVSVSVTAANFTEISGYQFTLEHAGLELVDLRSGALEMSMSNIGQIKLGTSTMSWHTVQSLSTSKEAVLFELVFRATEALILSDRISLTDKVTRGESYRGSDLSIEGVSLEIRDEIMTPVNTGMVLGQNLPNPWMKETVISLSLAEAGQGTLMVKDAQGRVVSNTNYDWVSGDNKIVIKRSELPSAGVYFYTVIVGAEQITKPMVVIK